ncbi:MULTISPECIES: DUF1315 family protein [unclassified Motilimonas]|uniref:YeaC family protein n=1 Tax=Motilimonas TaxID=1914248 RepID=UPI001E5E3EB5|nr:MULTISPECIES: DUF1315 family protein [unclassified Motilimonas]MCE0556133.1 DUF1315 family protein [Motilimonas sp. E26]MDO6527969.1 DUF1315 family protein [Motilimonas sp. 1_MG-2023]
MSFDNLIKNMSPEVYERLKTAVETGKWFDGNPLTKEQKEYALQGVFAWQAQFNEAPEHFTVAKGGEMHMKSKSELKQQYKEKISIKQQD